MLERPIRGCSGVKGERGEIGSLRGEMGILRGETGSPERVGVRRTAEGEVEDEEDAVVASRGKGILEAEEVRERRLIVIAVGVVVVPLRGDEGGGGNEVADCVRDICRVGTRRRPKGGIDCVCDRDETV